MASTALALAFHAPVVPQTPPVDMAVASDFERFTPTDPALSQPVTGQAGLRGSPTRPGAARYDGEAVYTPGSGGGLTNTLGGSPPQLLTSDRIHRSPGGWTPAHSPTWQFRLGVGQKGPSQLGVAQTISLAEITNNPPEGTPLLKMLAGLG